MPDGSTTTKARPSSRSGGGARGKGAAKSAARGAAKGAAKPDAKSVGTAAVKAPPAATVELPGGVFTTRETRRADPEAPSRRKSVVKDKATASRGPDSKIQDGKTKGAIMIKSPAVTSEAEQAISAATRAVEEGSVLPAASAPTPEAAPESATAVAAPLGAADPAREAADAADTGAGQARADAPAAPAAPSSDKGSARDEALDHENLPRAGAALDLADRAQETAYAALDQAETAMADAGRGLAHAPAMTRGIAKAVTDTMADPISGSLAFYPGFVRAAGERAAIDMSESLNALRRSGRATGEAMEANSAEAAEVLGRARSRAVDLAKGQVSDGHALVRDLMTARTPGEVAGAQTAFATARARAFAEAASAATADMMRFFVR